MQPFAQQGVSEKTSVVMKVKRVVTHIAPHFDEVVALWLLMRFGNKSFPGASQLIRARNVEFWSLGRLPEGFSSEQAEKDGILCLGIGGGKYDEHPQPGQPRKEGQCAATLIAKALGVESHYALEQILNFVLMNDNKGSGHPFDLAHLVEAYQRIASDKPWEVISFIFQGLDMKYKEKLHEARKTLREFRKTAQTELITGPRGLIKLITVCSDDELIVGVARKREGAAVVIRKESNGHVQIFTNLLAHPYITLKDVAKVLNVKEQRIDGPQKVTNFRVLEAEGMITGGRWYYFPKTQALLNGSKRAEMVPPTRIPLSRIQEIVKICLNPQRFEPEHATSCMQGRCILPCGWHRWGLSRCGAIRFHQKQKQVPVPSKRTIPAAVPAKIKEVKALTEQPASTPEKLEQAKT